MSLSRSCSICTHISEPRDFNHACWRCGFDHELFQLDKKKLNEEINLGLMSKKTAQEILEISKKDEGIPNQKRLTSGIE